MEKIKCECGCGKTRDKFDKRGRERRFITGHQGKFAREQLKKVWNSGKKNIYSEETLEKMRVAKLGTSFRKGKLASEETKKNISIAKLKEWKNMSEDKKEERRNRRKGMYGYIGKINCEKCNKELVVYTTTQRFCGDCKQIHHNEYSLNRLKNEENNKIHKARQKARQVLLKKSCEICSSTNNLQRHHWRYDKPLMVNTLCKTCHSIQHIKHFEKSKYAGGINL